MIYNQVNMKQMTDCMMRPVIMRLNVLEVCRVFEGSIIPVQFLHPSIYQFCG